MKLREELPEFSSDLKWFNRQVTKEKIIGDIPVLVHFWSVSCKLCKGSMVTLNKWKNSYENKFNIVSVHMPRTKEDTNEQLIRSTIDGWNMTHPVCLDHDLIVSNIYQNRIVPAFYLFDKSGLLRHYQVGENGMQMLERRLKLLMNEPKK